jgi:hypothetical protein
MSARFLIEVPHGGTMAACVNAVEIFHKTGSHFLTHADWGCKDGVHKAWMVVDVDTRDEAKAIVPPLFRQHATIVQLNSFTTDDVENLRRHLAG